MLDKENFIKVRRILSNILSKGKSPIDGIFLAVGMIH